MAQQDDLSRYRANLQGEVDSVALYTALAEAEKDAKVAQVYRQLAAVEQKHVEVWQKAITDKGGKPVDVAPSLRARILCWIARRFGPSPVLPVIVATEAKDHSAYQNQPEALAAGLPADEQLHSRIIRTAMAGSGGLAGPEIARLEGRHRAGSGRTRPGVRAAHPDQRFPVAVRRARAAQPGQRRGAGRRAPARAFSFRRTGGRK